LFFFSKGGESKIIREDVIVINFDVIDTLKRERERSTDCIYVVLDHIVGVYWEKKKGDRSVI
jgi:hypothetical protein